VRAVSFAISIDRLSIYVTCQTPRPAALRSRSRQQQNNSMLLLYRCLPEKARTKTAFRPFGAGGIGEGFQSRTRRLAASRCNDRLGYGRWGCSVSSVTRTACALEVSSFPSQESLQMVQEMSQNSLGWQKSLSPFLPPWESLWGRQRAEEKRPEICRAYWMSLFTGLAGYLC